MHKSLAIIAGTIVVLVLAYFAYDATRSPCEDVFQQTAPRIRSSLEVIKSGGELFVGREQIQELTESAQKVGQHLKLCCIALDNGRIETEDFKECVSHATDYEARVVGVVERIEAARAEGDRGRPGAAEAAKSELASEITLASAEARRFAEQVRRIEPGPTRADGPGEPRAEREPNNTILESNAIGLGDAISAEIAATDDHDFYRVRNSGTLRDRVTVTLENHSTTLRPWIKLYDLKRSELGHRYDGTAGASVAYAFTAEPESDYYVHVLPYDSRGKYQISVVPQEAYDGFEPNDDVLSAATVGVGSVVQAGVLDAADNDWYRLTGVHTEKIDVRLENRSATLRPWVQVYDRRKSEILSRYDGTAGADLEFSLPTTPGEDYYLRVLPYDSYGAYRLTAR